MIANGAMSPITGFMCCEDYNSVINNMRLKDGQVWSLPITLAVSRECANGNKTGEEIALVEAQAKTNGKAGHILGVMKVEEKFEYAKQHEARQVYRTTDTAHPGVARLMQQGEACLGGEIWLVDRPAQAGFPEYRRDPAETR